MLAAVLAAVVMLGSGFMRGRSLPIYLAFGAAMPGIMLYRWGRGLAQLVPARQARPLQPAPVKTVDTGHELKLDTIPSGPDVTSLPTPPHPSGIPPHP